MRDYYSILGVSFDATAEEIRAAYFDLAKKYHPDVTDDPKAHDRFVEIQEAYDVLSNAARRAKYDASLPDTVKKGPEVTLSVRTSRMVIPRIQEPQLFYALVDLICTAEYNVKEAPPFHICLVLDRSTSMHGARMDMVKSSALNLLKQFRKQDLISVVAFSDRAEVVIPPTRVPDLAKDDHRISMLQVGGGTEIYQGLQLGIEQLRSIDPRFMRQLILLTDGHTYGDDEACIELAEEAAQDGIQINTMGIGHEWNDELLDKIATISGANSIFVTSPKDLNKFFEQKLQLLNDTYARGLSLEFTLGEGVELKYAFRLHPETSPLPAANPIPLGTLMYHKSMSLLFEFVIHPISADVTSLQILTGKIKMELPSAQSLRARLPIQIKRAVMDQPEPESPPPALIEALGKLTLYRMQEKIQKEVEEGQIDKATRRLHYLATQLLSQGDRELAHAVLLEAEHLQQSRTFSREGDKRIKYGTRALLLPSGMEH